MWLYGIKNKLILFSHYPPSFLKWSISGGSFIAFSVNVACYWNLFKYMQKWFHNVLFFLNSFHNFFSSKTQLCPSVCLGWNPWSHPWLEFFSHDTPWIPADTVGCILKLYQTLVTFFCATASPLPQAIMTKCGLLSQPPLCCTLASILCL